MRFYFVFADASSTSEDGPTSSLSHHNHSGNELNHDRIPNDVDTTNADELVKPSKIHVQPLHAGDLLYESMKFDPSAGL